MTFQPENENQTVGHLKCSQKNNHDARIQNVFWLRSVVVKTHVNSGSGMFVGVAKHSPQNWSLRIGIQYEHVQ